MRLKLAALALLISVSGLLWWQMQQNGKLKAVNAQYLTTINAQSEAMNDLAMKHLETNQMLADSRQYTSVLNRKAQGLADDLRNQMITALIALGLTLLLSGCGSSATIVTEYKREPVPAGWIVPVVPPELISGATGDIQYIQQCEAAIKQCNRDKADIRAWSGKE